MAAIRPQAPELEIDAGLPDPCDDVLDLDESWLGRIVTAEAIFITDERQQVRAWSNEAQRMLGYDASEVVGRACFKVMMGRRPDGHPVCDLSCPVTRNARRGRGTASYEVTAVDSTGSVRYLTNTVIVLEGKRGAFRVIHLMRESGDTPPARTTATAALSAASGAPPCAERLPAEQLTRRELEVLRLFARGLELDEVAAELSISTFTARNHATSIQHKLGVRNRLQMVLEGMSRGLV
jgi:PAS domain S-box-containing protein